MDFLLPAKPVDEPENNGNDYDHNDYPCPQTYLEYTFYRFART
jgi:hypothetical protein